MKSVSIHRFLTLGLLGAIAAAAAVPAMAQPGPRHAGPAQMLQQADGDRDGRVTEAEGLNFLSARFAEADGNKDGSLTREEISAFLKAQREARQPAGEHRDVPERARRGMESRLDAMFRAADSNRDGRVTFDEVQPLAVAMFRAADRNNDGALEASELRGRHHRGGGAPQRGERPAPAAPATPG